MSAILAPILADALELGWPTDEATDVGVQPDLSAMVPVGEVPPEFDAFPMGERVAVCTTLDDERATTRLNDEHPTGVAPWRVSPDPTFKGGGPNPGRCEEAPATHRHLLFEC
jgi:hypothetical protein